MRKRPKRQCVVTKEQLEKNELVRVVRTPERDVKIDLTGKLNGRGAYLKRSKEVVLEAQKRRSLERALNVEVDPQVYQELLELVDQE